MIIWAGRVCLLAGPVLTAGSIIGLLADPRCEWLAALAANIAVTVLAVHMTGEDRHDRRTP